MRNEEYLEKPLPSSEESEQTILGAVILDNKVFEDAYSFLEPKDFYSQFHRAVYQAMEALYYAGTPIDPITIYGYMKKKLKVTAWGTNEISGLTSGVPHFANLEEYVQEVKRTSVARKVLKVCNSALRDILAEDIDIEDILESTEQKFLKLNTSLTVKENNTEGFAEVQEIGPEVLQQFERYHSGEQIPGTVKTGMAPLDTILDGGALQPKGLYVVGGREKSGKTSLILDWAHNIAVVQKKTVLIATLEMSKPAMYKRLFSMHTGIPHFMFRPGFYDSDYSKPYTTAINAIAEFNKYPIKIADNLFTMSQLFRHCEYACEQGYRSSDPKDEVGLIVVDYLQLVRPDQGGKGKRTEDVEAVSRDLKQMANILNKPVAAISNLNRTGQSDGMEINALNLRDAHSIAFDAEALMFVINPSFVPGKPYEQQPVTDMILNVAAQRNGPTARIPLKFIGQFMSFMTEDEYAKYSETDAVPKSRGQEADQQKKLMEGWDSSS